MVTQVELSDTQESDQDSNSPVRNLKITTVLENTGQANYHHVGISMIWLFIVALIVNGIMKSTDPYKEERQEQNEKQKEYNHKVDMKVRELHKRNEELLRKQAEQMIKDEIKS